MRAPRHWAVLHYDIEVGGRLRRVTVTRAGGGFAVDVDGRAHQVDAVRIDAHTLSLIVDKVWLHDTVIAPEAAGGIVVRVGAMPVPVTVNGRRRHGLGSKRAVDSGLAAAPSGRLRILAPMPGKVVRVLVAVGEVVHAAQPVAVVEAMKMENEVRAGRGGTVAEIHALQGASVDAGALLVVIQ